MTNLNDVSFLHWQNLQVAGHLVLTCALGQCAAILSGVFLEFPVIQEQVRALPFSSKKSKVLSSTHSMVGLYVGFGVDGLEEGITLGDRDG